MAPSTNKERKVESDVHIKQGKYTPGRASTEHNDRNKNKYESRHMNELDILEREKEETKSQISRYKRESLKLRKLQLEEDKRKQLFLNNKEFLLKEIEEKKKIEQELLKRISQLEIQEQDLNTRRNDNEMLEKEIQETRQQDITLSTKIRLLKQKERLLLKRQDDRESEYSYRREISRKDNDQFEEYESQIDSNSRTLKTRERYLHEHYPMFKLGSPKIPQFDGKDFDQWEMEVSCLLRTKMYPDYAIVQAIRNSLMGETRQVLLTMKPTATSNEILEKLREIYGDIKTGDKAVQNFYSAEQKEGELCSAWGVRVETLFQKAVEKGEISERRRESKLKERFWRGLYSDKLKNATRVCYESSETFERLRRKARQEEDELSSNLVNVKVSQQKDTDEKLSILQELLDRMKTLESDVGRIKSQSYSRGGYQGRYENRYRGMSRARGYRGYNYRNPNSDKYEKATSEKKDHNEKKETVEANLNENALPSSGKMEVNK